MLREVPKRTDSPEAETDMARKTGLGKGLDSLISSQYADKLGKTDSEGSKSLKKSTKSGNIVDKTVDNRKNPAKETSEKSREKSGKRIGEKRGENTVQIPMILVERNPDQPRQNFDEESLNELADSIRQYGILEPLLVKPSGDHYIIVAGERRWRAAKIAGLKEIPAIIRDYTDQEIMEISLIENIQRENLNVMEEAQAYQKLLTDFGYKQEDLAKKISRSRTSITNRLRLLKLTEKVQDMVRSGELSEGHARALLPLEKPEEQYQTAKVVVENHMSVRETERLVKKMLHPKNPAGRNKDWEKEDQFVYDKLEEDLRTCMGTKVAIQRKEKDKGKIVIDYYSSDDLERLMDLFHKL